MDTLERAKNDLRQGWETPNGATCACCGQLVKLYKRKFNSSMARDLIALYRKTDSGYTYYHSEEIAKGNHSSREISRVLHWGLVEEQPNQHDKNKRTSGYWRITSKGMKFVEGRNEIASHIFIYNQRLYGFSDTNISIHQALGNKFSYPELMGYLI